MVVVGTAGGWGIRNARQKKRRGVAAAFKVAKSDTDYLETDFLNMRSIFSLIASMAVEFACAVDRA
jgi:hypothetical protein